MKLRDSRFADQIGPHCPARACTADVIRCTDGTKDVLIHPDPTDSGTFKVSDTGNPIPHVRKLDSTRQFGLQGSLHTRHEDNCAHFKRWKRRHA